MRNAFLAAALELRAGMFFAPALAASADMLRALTTEQLLDLAAIQLDAEKAAGERFTLNLVSDLLPLLAGMTSLEALAKSGKATVVGDGAKFARLRSFLVSFRPDFEIMPGTRAATR